jgi:hypothetical protein
MGPLASQACELTVSFREIGWVGEVRTRFENRCCSAAEPQKSLRGFSRSTQRLSRLHLLQPCHPRTASAPPEKSVQTSGWVEANVFDHHEDTQNKMYACRATLFFLRVSVVKGLCQLSLAVPALLAHGIESPLNARLLPRPDSRDQCAYDRGRYVRRAYDLPRQ